MNEHEQAKTKLIEAAILVAEHLRAAFRTNEPQATTLVAVTALNLIACGLREHETPWWLWVGAGLFWPAFVFVHNLIDPIPANRERDKDMRELNE
jgi:hypothetical protein